MLFCQQDDKQASLKTVKQSKIWLGSLGENSSFVACNSETKADSGLFEGSFFLGVNLTPSPAYFK